MTVMPELKYEFAKLEKDNPELAEQLRPYVEHLTKWDLQAGIDSTEASLCYAWYLELHTSGDLGADTKMQPKYMLMLVLDWSAEPAAQKMKFLFGDWKVPWGSAARLQRIINVRDRADFSGFSMDKPSSPVPVCRVKWGLFSILITFHRLPPKNSYTAWPATHTLRALNSERTRLRPVRS